MSITDELRKWAEEFWEFAYSKFGDKSELLAIADRIDAEHEEAIQREHEVGHAEGYGAGLATVALGATEWIAQHEGEMAKQGWIRLPKDADGEYIHIGDEVETTNFGTVEVEGFVHRAVAFYNYSEQPAYLCTTPANLCRHHHAPTVEDVLTEMLAKVIERGELTNGAAQTIAEYAKRLTLAEGEDA